MNDIEYAAPRVLMLIPSRIDPETKSLSALGKRPRTDYHALQERLAADIIDYSSLEGARLPLLVRLLRVASRDAALAMLGYVRRADYDIIFTNAENVGIPLALFLRAAALFSRFQTRHVMIGHRLSARKKQLLLRMARSQIHAVLVYSKLQQEIAQHKLGYESSRLEYIAFHADHEFFRPGPIEADVFPPVICSAGMEWRDYPTLISAVDGLSVDLRIAAYSPWSSSKRRPDAAAVPQNVTVQRHDYSQLRDLYARSRFVVVPILQTDFQAGITTIIEAMSMGKAIITSQTNGMAGAIQDGVNGVLVPPGDARALRKAIENMLQNPVAAISLGLQARRDVEGSFTLNHWVERVRQVIYSVWSEQLCSASASDAVTERI